MYICVHSDLMSKGPSDREGQSRPKTSPTRNRSRIWNPENDPERVEVADIEIDTNLSLFIIICVLSNQPFQYFHSY
jgi:hypothetical protein